MPDNRYWWGLLALIVAGALGVRMGRLKDEDPKRGRVDVVFDFFSNSTTWLVVAILATVFIGFGLLSGFYRPWDPLQHCTQTDLADEYTDHRCLARAGNGALRLWEEEGAEYIYDSGHIDEANLEVVGPSAEPYTWQWRPITSFLLTIAAVGGFGLFAWLRAGQRRSR